MAEKNKKNYEPLIAMTEGVFGSGEDEDAVEDDVGVRTFSWLEYFSFFTIGMSKMWTW